MNKDEADKWRAIAQKAIVEHDYQKALRFLDKSNKLFHTSEADAMIKVCEMNLKNRSNGGNTTSTANESSNGAYKRSNTKKPDSEESTKQRSYTAEEVKLWKEILAKTDYYQILGLEKKATEAEIKKSYRKLALKLHPDKNGAPKATDAFKKVSQAYVCLSDTQKRQIYDEHGTEANFRQNYRQYFREEEDMDMFDLFDLFTGGMNHRQRMNRQRRPQNHRHPQQQQAGNQGWQQFLPIIFILFLMLMANIGSNLSTGPSYSFAKSSDYSYQLETSTHNVQYFVDKDTFDLIRGSTRTTHELENTIENDFYRINSRKCRQAKETQNHWVRQARRYTKGHDRYNQGMEKAEEVDMSSWEVIQEMNDRIE